jgi:hypothetical protein
MANRTVVNNEVIVAQSSATGLSGRSVAKPNTGSWSEFKIQPAKNVNGSEDRKLLHEIETDSVNIPPVKRCKKCVGCKDTLT